MRATTTLSTAQWLALQNLFDEGAISAPHERRALIDRTRAADILLGDMLTAMFAAHDERQGRTAEAGEDWQRQARDSALLANGDRIGPYRIAGVLGEGGMGVVYRAERADGEVRQEVAVKVLRPGALDGAARERFRRERDMLAALNHPHIARLFDAGERADGRMYFVMEYLRGATLTCYCDEHRLDLPTRLKLFLAVCDAVRYAHGQLVLHRDIKPANVMVDEHGEPKLIDFGIAKPITLDAEQAADTATAQRFFSPMNVAPEQLRGERMGVACDVYQLGTLMYELLCGQSIFDLEGKTPSAIEQAILQQMPQAPSVRAFAANSAVAMARGCADAQALSRQLRGDLDEIALLALRKEPERRYASVEQLIEDINRHLDSRPVHARGSHRAYRMARFAKRNWQALSLAALAVAAVVAFVVALTHQSMQLQRERDRAVAQQHRAEEATKFLVSVFKAADPNESMTRTMPIGDVLENGRRKVDVELSGQPQLKADMLFAIADVYANLDSLSDAESYAQQSLALRESVLPESIPVAESLGQLARIRAIQGNCEQTQRTAAKALELYRRLGAGAARTSEVEAEVIICESHDKGDEYGRDRISALLEALEHDPEATVLQIAQLELEAAPMFTNVGDMEGAARLDRAAAQRLEQSIWKDTAMALHARTNLANILSQTKKYDEAVVAFDQLVPDYARIFGKNSIRYATTLTDRGANYYDMHRYQDAEADFLEAKHVYAHIRPDPHPDRAAAAINLASLYDEGLKDSKRAGPYYEEALQQALAVWGPHDGNTQQFRAAKADWLRETGSSKEAQTELEALRQEIPTSRRLGIKVRLILAELDIQSHQSDPARQLLDECAPAIKPDPSDAEFAEKLAALRKQLDAS
jgi:eukaryotic-like serine/threonine-protein kinase